MRMLDSHLLYRLHLVNCQPPAIDEVVVAYLAVQQDNFALVQNVFVLKECFFKESRLQASTSIVNFKNDAVSPLADFIHHAGNRYRPALETKPLTRSHNRLVTRQVSNRAAYQSAKLIPILIKWMPAEIQPQRFPFAIQTYTLRPFRHFLHRHMRNFGCCHRR